MCVCVCVGGGGTGRPRSALSPSDILQSLSETTVHRNVHGSRKKEGTSEGRKGKAGAEMKEAVVISGIGENR